MAVKKNGKEDVLEEKVIKPKAKTKLEKENDELKEQLSQMSGMMEQMKQFMATQQPKAENKVDIVEATIDDFEDMKDVPINKLINITSLFDGDLTLFGLNNNQYRFTGFGVTRPLTYENIIQIVGNYNKWARDGMFYIHNEDAVRLLGLEYDYKKILTKEDMINIIDKPEDELRRLLLSASSEQKETVKYLVARGMNSDDRRFSNRNKIEIIADILKMNMSDYADILKWK